MNELFYNLTKEQTDRLRDEFAMAALTGLVAQHQLVSDFDIALVVDRAFIIANTAMERRKSNE